MNPKKIYRRIAKKHGISPEEVEASIQEAINAAWTNPHKTGEVSRHQAEVLCAGKVPTSKEVLLYAANKITKPSR